MVCISEIKFYQDGIRRNIRKDGRERNHHREIEFREGAFSMCNSSCTIRLGEETEVSLGIKVDLKSKSTFDKAIEAINFELTGDCELVDRDLFDCSVEFSKTNPVKNWIEKEKILSLKLKEMIKSARMFNIEKFEIVPGISYFLYINALVLKSHGNVFDAITLALKKALLKLQIPKFTVENSSHEKTIRDLTIEKDIETINNGLTLDREILTEKVETLIDKERIQDQNDLIIVENIPINITLNVLDDFVFFDANGDEEKCCDRKLEFAVNGKNQICRITTEGCKSIEVGKLFSLRSSAVLFAEEMNKKYFTSE